MKFNVPIPGQSLTTTPKNTPYERPPQIHDPRKALAKHLDHLSDSKRMDSVMQLLERGIPLNTLTEGILRSAVAEGIHSIDVSLLIAPVLHEYIKSYASDVGVEFKEGFEEPSLEEIQVKAGQLKSLSALKAPQNAPMKTQEAPAPVEEPQPTQETPKRGFMQRRT